MEYHVRDIKFPILTFSNDFVFYIGSSRKFITSKKSLNSKYSQRREVIDAEGKYLQYYHINRVKKIPSKSLFTFFNPFYFIIEVELSAQIKIVDIEEVKVKVLFCIDQGIEFWENGGVLDIIIAGVNEAENIEEIARALAYPDGGQDWI